MFVLCPVLLITPGLFGAPAVYFSFSNQQGQGQGGEDICVLSLGRKEASGTRPP